MLSAVSFKAHALSLASTDKLSLCTLVAFDVTTPDVSTFAALDLDDRFRPMTTPAAHIITAPFATSDLRVTYPSLGTVRASADTSFAVIR